MRVNGNVYLSREKAAALYSYGTGKMLNDTITVGAMNWAARQHGFFVFGCKTFGDFISSNRIQIIDDCSCDCNNCDCKNKKD